MNFEKALQSRLQAFKNEIKFAADEDERRTLQAQCEALTHFCKATGHQRRTAYCQQLERMARGLRMRDVLKPIYRAKHTIVAEWLGAMNGKVKIPAIPMFDAQGNRINSLKEDGFGPVREPIVLRQRGYIAAKV